ncbi:hypothetical protein ACFYO9_15865 [Streptomyces sp. NPDC005863]|uniref:hypothetical protein n=1 Tax=unclassified Streptomyces TaxID=2593676 RepID=UPI0033F28F11
MAVGLLPVGALRGLPVRAGLPTPVRSRLLRLLLPVGARLSAPVRARLLSVVRAWLVAHGVGPPRNADVSRTS